MSKIRIGRSDTNDIVLDDTSVSRKHAEIEDLGGGAWRLTDIGSSAGTFVKEAGKWTQISTADIDSDTEVRFGEAEFHLSAIVNADPATIRPETESGLGQRAEVGAAEISMEMRQPSGTGGSGGSGGASATGGGGGWSGMTKNTKILIMGGAGVMLLIIIAVILVAVMDDDVGRSEKTGGGATGSKAELARLMTANCQKRGKQSSAQCECVGREMAASLTEEEAGQLIAARRAGRKPPSELAIKLLGGIVGAARKCATVR